MCDLPHSETPQRSFRCTRYMRIMEFDRYNTYQPYQPARLSTGPYNMCPTRPLRIAQVLHLMVCSTLVLAALTDAGETPQPSDKPPPRNVTITGNNAAASASDRAQAGVAPAPEPSEAQASVRGDDLESAGSDGLSGNYQHASCGVGGWWFDADYLLLWTNGNSVPALVTTNATVPPRSETGVLGVGDTSVLLGDDRLDERERSGVALTVGRWLDEQQAWGIQATWFYAGEPSDELHAGWQSLGDPVLARPFFNAATGQEDSQLVAYPDVVEGLVTAETHSYLQSGEALLRANWRRGTRGRIDVLGGYRYLGFREGLRVEEHLVLRDPGGLAQIGTTINLFDQFNARNDFHGGELGLLTSFYRGPIVFDIATKLGLGNVSRELVIDGSTYVQTPKGSHATTPGGLLALPSNMGTYRDDAFALLPELDLKASFQITQRLSLSVGYNLLFLTDVYRTGQQIDRSLDASQLPGALPLNDITAAGHTHPAPLLSSSTLCAQGLKLGVSLTY